MQSTYSSEPCSAAHLQQNLGACPSRASWCSIAVVVRTAVGTLTAATVRPAVVAGACERQPNAGGHTPVM